MKNQSTKKKAAKAAQLHHKQDVLNFMGLETEQEFVRRMSRQGYKFVQPETFEAMLFSQLDKA